MKSMCVLSSVAVLIVAARLSGGQALQRGANDPAVPIHVGRWTSHFEHGGLFVDFDGIPLIKGGIVQLFSPDYKRGYYGSGSHPPSATIELLADGGCVYSTEYRYTADGNSFRAAQRIEIHPDNTVRLTLRSRWDSREQALLEWNPARLWAYPLVGAQFEATPMDAGAAAAVARGSIPLRPAPNATALANRVAAGWKRLALRLPLLGDLILTNENPESPGQSPALLDGRNDPYLQNDRLFWLGFPGATLDPGQERIHAIAVTLVPRSSTPAPAYIQGPSQVEPVTVQRIPDAVLPLAPLEDTAGRPLIVPQPKRAVFTRADLNLRGRMAIALALPADEAGQRATRAAREFAAEIGRRTGVSWTDRRIDVSGRWNRRGLLVTTLDNSELARTLTPALPLQPEGYALLVTPEFAAIVGRDSAGAFHGLQTLRQLLRIDRGANASVRKSGRAPLRPRFLGANIIDWPSLRIRAAHLFVGKEALPFHRKLIDRIFSRYKLNTLLIECEFTRWKSHPEIWQPYSMDPDDLRLEVAYARDHFIEPIPLVNSLGHSEWMFENGQHTDLAEDVTAPHAYDASNPESYRFIFSVFGEALDIFHPRYFHIGHDEVKILGSDEFGKYPARPQNIAKGVTALFLEDTSRLAEWLRARGVAPILWGDMLLHSSEGEPGRQSAMTAANAPTVAEAQTRRRLLPKDSIIADWRYEPGSEQRNGLEVFHAAGHETLGTAWFEPENIRGWARQAVEKGALGTIQATWAGYDSKEALLDEEYRQFTAFILAAEYAWSGTELHPRPLAPDASLAESGLLPYDAAEIFARSYTDVPALSGPRFGWSLNLDSADNVALADAAATSYLTTASAPGTESHGGQPAPTSETGRAVHGAGNGIRAADTRFRLAWEHSGGIMLHGLLQPESLPSGRGETRLQTPGSVTLTVGAKAGELLFVHATLHGLENDARVAEYTIVYSDGQTVSVPLRYGREIRALDDGSPEQAFSTGRLPVPKSGAYLRIFHWRNPRPQSAIAQIRFKADNPLASPILFAVTGVAPRPEIGQE